MSRSSRTRARPAAAYLALAVLLTTVFACDSGTRAPESGDSDTGAGAVVDSAGAQALADTLRGMIEEAYDFARPDVPERMGALYPTGGRVISASGGHVMTSPDSLRQGIADFWANVGRNMREPRWEWGDVYVDRLGPDAAVLTATWSLPHIAPTERVHVLHGAWTAVFRRLDGEWTIVHEHLSVPMPE